MLASWTGTVLSDLGRDSWTGARHVDVDERGHIVGLEILDASKRLSPSDLTSITIEKLPLEITTP